MSDPHALDLFVDLNAEDNSGLPWSLLSEAVDPAKVVPGAVLVVGSGSTRAVARVIDIDAEGVVHVLPLPGPVSANAHLLSPAAHD